MQTQPHVSSWVGSIASAVESISEEDAARPRPEGKFLGSQQRRE
jgi:hypothetical protein